MYTTNGVGVYIRDGRSWGLSNEFDNVFDLYDAIEESKSAEQLRDKLNVVANDRHWDIDRETTAYTRLTNPKETLFLVVKKEQTMEHFIELTNTYDDMPIYVNVDKIEYVAKATEDCNTEVSFSRKVFYVAESYDEVMGKMKGARR